MTKDIYDSSILILSDAIDAHSASLSYRWREGWIGAEYGATLHRAFPFPIVRVVCCDDGFSFFKK